ncbi:hypothetical protein B0T21DRAFT_380379 [Apiosordaria backusii]|uniref:Uncharacterized protein n=1 Tax=Apiosordaria backusii TaxID=314023 RepID=A0AA40EZT7_9PEZI|nr:hypothetical protein B0T21DRAFT_380379 [Apiosordaria backusii]
MDHFNATIKDGKLVNTRRGLQVSRQKFNGISFVNTSAQDSSPSGEQSFRLATESPSNTATHPQVTFVDNENNLQSSGIPKNTEQGQGQKPNLSFVSESGQQQQTKKQPRRRTALKAQHQHHHRRTSTSPYLSSPDSRPSSRSSAVTPSPRADETAFQYFQQPQQQQPFTSSAPPPLPLPPPWPPTELSSTTGFYPAPFSPSQSDLKLFHHYNTHFLALQLYPYEDVLTYNPARSDSEESSIASSDIAAFHCVLMCGTIAEAVIHGQHHLSSEPETEARGFAYHISKICAILNKKLDGNHWHMHMRGLQKVLDVLGGWVREQGCRRGFSADLKGATALASTPYLRFTRSLLPSPTTAILPPVLVAHVSHTLNSILQPLNIHPSVLSTLTSLATFSSAVRLARQSTNNSTGGSSRAIKFDPYSFTEELHQIPNVVSGVKEAETTPPDMTQQDLEPSLRIASLLFLKELLPDYPRNLGGYKILLGILRQHLERIYQHVIKPLIEGELLSPSSKKQELKQVLLYLCLVGDVATQRANENECRHQQHDDDDDGGGGTARSSGGQERQEDEDYPRGIFHACLLSVIGVNNDITEKDLEFARLFDLRGIMGETWDDHDGVKRLLSSA